MGKKVDNTVLDGAFAIISGNATRLIVLDAEPADRATALANELAGVAISSGDFSTADGDTSGRKVTVAQQASISIGTSGNANHVAIISGTLLLYVTTCTTQALTSGGTVTVPAWDIEIADPT